MAITYIAFIECSMKKNWLPTHDVPYYNPQRNMEYRASGEAEVYMVDIKGDRRMFSFKKDSKVHIVNNTFVYESEDAEELAIDESKQFPKKKRMDE